MAFAEFFLPPIYGGFEVPERRRTILTDDRSSVSLLFLRFGCYAQPNEYLGTRNLRRKATGHARPRGNPCETG